MIDSVTKSLMYGDSVYYTHQPDGLTTQRVVGIVVGYNAKTDSVYLQIGDDCRWVNASDVSPIPLSQEFLVNNGFYHKRENEYRYSEDIDIELGGSVDGKSIMNVWYDVAHKLDVSNTFSVKYIHEYQQILRMFGYEEIADNIKH